MDQISNFKAYDVKFVRSQFVSLVEAFILHLDCLLYKCPEEHRFQAAGNERKKERILIERMKERKQEKRKKERKKRERKKEKSRQTAG
jgi:hypothetical protein